jgi:hypothetical protein
MNSFVKFRLSDSYFLQQKHQFYGILSRSGSGYILLVIFHLLRFRKFAPCCFVWSGQVLCWLIGQSLGRELHYPHALLVPIILPRDQDSLPLFWSRNLMESE